MNFRKTLRFVPIFLVLALIVPTTVVWAGDVLAPISIYDEGDLVKISIEDVGEYHGDVCTCVAIGYRAIKTAINQLWANETPKRGDFKVITAHPGKGSQDCFEFVTRVKTRKKGKDFMLKMPAGTGRAKFTKDNFVFTFVRKSTGEQVTVRVKEKIIPKDFSMLRKKVKFDLTATPEEKKKFKSVKKEFKNKFLTLPSDELFEISKN